VVDYRSKLERQSSFAWSRALPCHRMERDGPEKAVATDAYASFLIRLWCEGGEDEAAMPGSWRAEVEHIQSGRLRAFDDVDGALSYVRRQTRGQRAGTEAKSVADLDLP